MEWAIHEPATIDPKVRLFDPFFLQGLGPGGFPSMRQLFYNRNSDGKTDRDKR
jgi:hypothetical protein